ncbi:hypothetical protein D3C73_1305700 [compost metagenome]
MDDPHHNGIITCRQKRRNLEFKGRIAVLPLACYMTINVEGGIHIYAFKAKRYTVLRRLLQREYFPVPAFAVLIEGLRIVNQPVMRQGNRHPVSLRNHLIQL